MTDAFRCGMRVRSSSTLETVPRLHGAGDVVELPISIESARFSYLPPLQRSYQTTTANMQILYVMVRPPHPPHLAAEAGGGEPTPLSSLPSIKRKKEDSIVVP